MNQDREHPLARRRFIHVPGPNPILRRGEPGEWDDGCLEAGDIFKEYSQGRELYYLYYHAFPDKTRSDKGYSIGVATSVHPLGPFVKYDGNPILTSDSEKPWEDIYVACPTILKQGPDRYLMFYYGRGTANGRIGNVCVAEAEGPLGPWRKYTENPVRPDFGYVSGVTQVDGMYYMYAEHPIDSTGQDYGSLSVATAQDPFGPWTLHPDNPILKPTGWGTWNDGGFSEAKVVYHNGFFHTFYGGAKLQPDRRRTLESIGYAFSADGIHFTEHVDNPVAPRERTPDASAFAEVQCLFEPPFVYLYHTLRYLSVPDEDILIEDLGVQVLATDRPFKLSMPVLVVDALRAGDSTALEDSSPVNLERIGKMLITVRCKTASPAVLRIAVRRSFDGMSYDTEDWHSFEFRTEGEGRTQRTYEFEANASYAKVLLENAGEGDSVRGIEVIATLMA
jgi:hypothetical protein